MPAKRRPQAFNQWKDISRIFRTVFGADPFAQPTGLGQSLDRLYGYRNVIAHNAGAVDAMFLERMQSPTAAMGSHIAITTDEVRTALQTAFDAVFSLVNVVNAWEAQINPSCIRVHTPFEPSGGEDE